MPMPARRRDPPRERPGVASWRASWRLPENRGGVTRQCTPALGQDFRIPGKRIPLTANDAERETIADKPWRRDRGRARSCDALQFAAGELADPQRNVFELRSSKAHADEPIRQRSAVRRYLDAPMTNGIENVRRYGTGLELYHEPREVCLEIPLGSPAGWLRRAGSKELGKAVSRLRPERRQRNQIRRFRRVEDDAADA